MTAGIVKDLLEKERILVKGMYSAKSDKKYDAFVSIEEWTGKDGKIRIGYKMEFPEKSCHK